jgi:hypothetical protein
MLPSYLAGATQEGRCPAARSEERSLGKGAGHGAGDSRYGLVASARNQSPAFGLPGRVHNPAKVACTGPQLNDPIARRTPLQLCP